MLYCNGRTIAKLLGTTSHLASQCKMLSPSHSLAACATSCSTKRCSARCHIRVPVLEAWRADYNTSRPHSRLGWMSPAIYAADRRSAALRYTDGSAPRAAVTIAQEGNVERRHPSGYDRRLFPRGRASCRHFPRGCPARASGVSFRKDFKLMDRPLKAASSVGEAEIRPPRLSRSISWPICARATRSR